ncbi:hypothetical protein [Flagellimonas sp.]|uniref:hypothetical protein n=1 Tax=Flagellimonas sp. TaxID=2058762 RepID=UPI003BA9E752
MKCVELNPEGNFDNWEPCKIEELAKMDDVEANPDHIIFEDERVALSVIVLEPYERTPFRKINNDFSLSCLTGGLLISRFSHGGISLLKFEKGETSFHSVEGLKTIRDFQNVSEDVFVMALLEYKP